MREIKFRVWCTFAPWRNTKPEMVYFDLEEYAADQDSEYGNHEININENSVMQFTGLKDKNGKEIYEGDIVRDEFKRVMLLDWHTNGFKFKALTPTNFLWAHDINEWFSGYGPFPEVIGNIHANPDLMEVKP